MVYNPRMAELGRYNRLRIVKRADIGIFLDGGEFGEILLPRKYVQDSMQVGDDVEVFVYNDSEDRICPSASSKNRCKRVIPTAPTCLSTKRRSASPRRPGSKITCRRTVADSSRASR
jgi:hypothetical protein